MSDSFEYFGTFKGGLNYELGGSWRYAERDSEDSDMRSVGEEHFGVAVSCGCFPSVFHRDD